MRVKIEGHLGQGERVVEAKMHIFKICRATWGSFAPTKAVQELARRNCEGR